MVDGEDAARGRKAERRVQRVARHHLGSGGNTAELAFDHTHALAYLQQKRIQR